MIRIKIKVKNSTCFSFKIPKEQLDEKTWEDVMVIITKNFLIQKPKFIKKEKK